MSAVPAVLFAAAKVWHYWIAVALTLGAVLTVLALVVGYLMKVQAPQYPPRAKK